MAVKAGWLFLLLALAGCAYTVTRQRVPPQRVATLDQKSPYIKAHMKDGRVYILTEWHVVEADHEVRGQGELLDVNRSVIRSGFMTVPIDSVALFESNVVRPSTAITGLTILTGLSVVLTAYCISNPKACFGSCPTFYVSDGHREILMAEGFSAAVAPVLERTDVDALYRARPHGGTVSVRMTNEALETHVVRSVDLLAAPRPDDGRVMVTPAGEFREVFRLVPPASAAGPEGDITARLAGYDGEERWSLADSTDLAAKEWLEVEFPDPGPGPAGLVIASRQSLLSTFLFYQTLAWMGGSAGEWLALLERQGSTLREAVGNAALLLGGIDVLVGDGAGGWLPAGAVLEAGPLASDLKVVPLPPAGQRGHPIRLRLRMTRGNLRIDYVALASIGPAVVPRRIRPDAVLHEGHADREALAALLDSTRTLVTVPGDEYTLVYHLPRELQGGEIFLESRGYYLEWMRQEWLREEDSRKALQMFLDPAGTLKALAPEFRKVEADAEASFWNSRYARP